jgi:ABC-2 type transport system permease protein
VRSAWLLAGAELRMLARDSVAWSTAIALPLVLGIAWLISAPPFGDGWSAVVALQVMGLQVFTLHTVGTMTLATRRQQRVLKRWRGSGASDVAILTGTLGVPVALVLTQSGALLAATWGLTTVPPAAPGLVAVAVAAATATVAGFTFVAAAFTRSSEHATVTSFPLIVLVLFGTYRGLAVAPDQAAWAELLVPGHAATQLLQLGWDGTAAVVDGGLAAAVWPHLLASVVLVGVAVTLAVRTFRWDPRH